MKILKNYKQNIIMLSSIILGIILGIIFKEKITFLSPLGNLFLNMLLIIVVPLIFLSITTSIYKMKSPQRLSKILLSTFIVFIITSLVITSIGIVSTYKIRLINPEDGKIIKEELSLKEDAKTEDNLNILERTVESISTNDTWKLLSKDNMIAVIVISILVGLAMLMAKDSSNPLYNVLASSYEVLQKLINLIMYYAPIGICAYVASLVGTFGSCIAFGYLKTFLIYSFMSVIIYFLVYSLYAYISMGTSGLKKFWQNILTPTITSLATCSSAASMPVNIEYTKKIGVSPDVAETSISLGTSFHKEGSILGSVFKIMFLVFLFDGMNDINIFKIIFISLVSSLLVTAVPIGGGTISETFIITMLGYPIGALPILTIIATIIDPPATLLNVVGDTASAMLITRLVDKHNE